jgi:2-polyprenyl-3-methyl-5-hydroxy-6-metoxy-1,4-benzoquinol methylase
MKTLAEIRGEGRMPTLEEYTAFYEAQANPRKGDGWTPSNQHIDTKFGRTQFALDHIKPGASVLECGTQDGGMTRHLVDAVGKKGYVVGIDIAPTYVKRAQEYLSESCPAGKYELDVADANDYYSRRRFDVIVCMEILEHVPDPRRLLANLWGLLRKNKGEIMITVPKDWQDDLGEHIHNYKVSDIIQIVGESTGIRPPVWQEGPWFFAIVDKQGTPYAT